MIELNTFDSAQGQAQALAQAVANALTAALASRPAPQRATLAVSGGKSPVMFFEHLATMPLDWSRVDLTLVDDRWVGDADPDSNAHLLRASLLKGRAVAAHFVPLVDSSRSPEVVAAALNQSERPALPDVAVLGMGEDGHTASIFADAPEWEFASTTQDRFVIVHPASAPHARISWSLQALKRVNALFLQIGGEKKRAVLDAAAATPQRNAISRLAVDSQVRLDVYWYA